MDRFSSTTSAGAIDHDLDPIFGARMKMGTIDHLPRTQNGLTGHLTNQKDIRVEDLGAESCAGLIPSSRQFERT